MGMLEDALRAYAKFEDRTTDPATPAAGEGLVYFKDGKLHSKDDAGTVVEYGAGGGGGGGDLALLDTVTLATTSTEIDFTAIPTGYSDLLVVGKVRTDRTGVTDDVRVRMGDDTFDSGSNYRWQIRREGDSPQTAGSGAETSFMLGENSSTGATAEAGAFATLELWVIDYLATATWRNIRWRTGAMYTSTVRRFIDGAGSWMNTADPVGRIRLFPVNGPNFVAGTSLRLYGRT